MSCFAELKQLKRFLIVIPICAGVLMMTCMIIIVSISLKYDLIFIFDQRKDLYTRVLEMLKIKHILKFSHLIPWFPSLITVEQKRNLSRVSLENSKYYMNDGNYNVNGVLHDIVNWFTINVCRMLYGRRIDICFKGEQKQNLSQGAKLNLI